MLPLLLPLTPPLLLLLLLVLPLLLLLPLLPLKSKMIAATSRSACDAFQGLRAAARGHSRCVHDSEVGV
jgi:hypothetical protein